MSAVPRILGTGCAVPETIRRNDDPVFDWLHANPVEGRDLFQGYDERRVLAEGEDLADLMVPAAQRALADAGVAASEVDILLGSGSISPTLVPNTLSLVHHRLGLSSRTWPIPLLNAFSEFPAAVMMADALIRAGRGTTALLVFGANWTRYVGYRTPQAISAGDGAAAVVIRMSDDANQWTMVDQLCDVDTSYDGAMQMRPSVIEGQSAPADLALPDERAFSHPLFHINAKGIEGFTEFGLKRAPKVVLDLLGRHGIDPSACCLITHQASDTLTKYWADQIQPGHYEDCLATFANMVSVSVPFNLAQWRARGAAVQDALVTLCLGPDMHASAMLFRR